MLLTLHTSFVFLVTSGLLFGRAQSQGCTSTQELVQKYGFYKSANVGVNNNHVYLGVVIDVSGGGGTNPLTCGVPTNEGIQQVEAVLWALRQKAVRFPHILPNITVGALFVDSCRSPQAATQVTANVEACQARVGQPAVEPDRVLAYIGPNALDVLLQVRPVVNGAGKPLLTYSVTSGEYGSVPGATADCPRVVRLAPSDTQAAAALVAVMHRLRWTSVQVVRDAASEASRLAAAALQTRATAAGVCVVQESVMEGDGSAAVASLMNLKATKGVILLLMGERKRAFYLAVKANSAAMAERFMWLTVDGQTDNLSLTGVEDVVSGALVLIQSTAAYNYTQFEDYFKNLRPGNAVHAGRNPWLDAYWTNRFRCDLVGGGSSHGRVCNYATDNLSRDRLSGALPFAVEAVDVALHGLHFALARTCVGAAGASLCSGFIASANRYNLMCAAMYTRELGGVRFDEVDLDAASATEPVRRYSYRLLNFRRAADGGQTLVGTLTKTANSPNATIGLVGDVLTYTASGATVKNAVSACSTTACPAKCPGAPPVTPRPTPIIDPTRLPATTQSVPDSALLRFRDRIWIYVLIVLAAIGLLVVMALEMYFVTRCLSRKHYITFDSFWLGQILLVALFCGYLLLFAWVPWPNVETCGLIRFGVGAVYALVFAVLLVKVVNIINRKYDIVLPFAYQFLLLFLAWAVQLGVNITWMIVQVADSNYIDNAWVCNHQFVHHVQTLSYCMFLIVLVTFLAIMSHGVNVYHREGVFIGLSAGFSIPIWISWIVVGALNDDNQDIMDGSIAFGLFADLTLILLLMFIPKQRHLHVDYMGETYMNGSDLKEGVLNEAYIVQPSTTGCEVCDTMGVVGTGIPSPSQPVYGANPVEFDNIDAEIIDDDYENNPNALHLVYSKKSAPSSIHNAYNRPVRDSARPASNMVEGSPVQIVPNGGGMLSPAVYGVAPSSYCPPPSEGEGYRRSNKTDDGKSAKIGPL